MCILTVYVDYQLSCTVIKIKTLLNICILVNTQNIYRIPILSVYFVFISMSPTYANVQFVLVNTLAEYSSLSSKSEFAAWADTIGWLIALSSALAIPVTACFVLWRTPLDPPHADAREADDTGAYHSALNRIFRVLPIAIYRVRAGF